jgi:hypothetical protein
METKVLTQMIENQFERCEPDDPNRCQSNDRTGQCRYRRQEPHQYCPRHLASQRTNIEREKVRNYQLTKFKARVNEFADNNQIKSLREEIGILRMTLEEVLNACQNTHQLMLQSNVIQSLVLNIERLVNSCHKLEESTNFLLDRTSIITLSSRMINLISLHVSDPEILEKISDDLLLEIESNES